MKNKNIEPKIFNGGGKATPKHDEMLLLFNRESKLLEDLLKKIENWEEYKLQAKEYFDKNNKKQKEVYYIKSNNKKILFKNKPFVFKSGYDNLLFCDINNTDEYHRTAWLEGNSAYFSEFEDRIKAGTIVEVNKEETIQLKDLKKIQRNPFIITEWSPEKPIFNSYNKFYIGSIDLFIKNSVASYLDLKNAKETLLWWGYNKTTTKKYSTIIEFKPKITSFSEAIRQIEVYGNYKNELGSMSSEKLIKCVITYSDISKYKEAFFSNNIYLIRLNENKEIIDSNY